MSQSGKWGQTPYVRQPWEYPRDEPPYLTFPARGDIWVSRIEEFPVSGDLTAIQGTPDAGFFRDEDQQDPRGETGPLAADPG